LKRQGFAKLMFQILIICSKLADVHERFPARIC